MRSLHCNRKTRDTANHSNKTGLCRNIKDTTAFWDYYDWSSNLQSSYKNSGKLHKTRLTKKMGRKSRGRDVNLS